MSRVLPAFCALLLVSHPAWALNTGLGAPPPTVDRQTPQASFEGFVQAAHAGDYTRAAHYLDLDFVSRGDQEERGIQLARRLKFVLDRKLNVDVTSLSKAPEGDPSDPRYDLLGTIPLNGTQVPIRLQRVASGEDGALVWVFSESSVKQVDKLFDEYGPILAETLPPVFFERPVLGLEPWQWLGLLVVLVGGWVASLVLERVTLAFAMRLAKWTKIGWDDSLVEAGRGPLRLPFYSAFLAIGGSVLLLPQPTHRLLERLSYSLLIIAVAWFILRFLRVTTAYVQDKVSQKAGEAGRLRSLSTQLAVMRRVLEVATYIVSSALLLMQFEVVRNVGVSLLASAGLAGLVIGLAAQKSISTLLAGIQLSITQPIRLGDQVVIESEFGTVEEITLTYVVVKVWDERRLVIPITQFLDKPFQNWSRATASMLGDVLLQVDFSTDIDSVRVELKRILDHEGGALWDGKVQSVVVLNVLEKTLSVRALVSAADPGSLFDLRCLVRERLIVFLRGHPAWLPTVRSEMRPLGPQPASSQGPTQGASDQPGTPPPSTPRA